MGTSRSKCDDADSGTGCESAGASIGASVGVSCSMDFRRGSGI